ncbi:MAG: hypothetical protein E7460_05950 [Ruminococcaceae bacterium]|nr:hypothetical protein [Oscillospiraceae bacterium]
MNVNEIARTLMESSKKHGLVNTLYRSYGNSIRVGMRYSEEVRNEGIDELMLSVRSYNALRRAGIVTVGTLIEIINDHGLSGIRNLGIKSCNEIKTKILAYGFEKLSENEKLEFFCHVAENNTKPRIERPERP